MKKMKLELILTNEEYASTKAILKVYGFGYDTLHLGTQGLIMTLIDALDDDPNVDEETLADAKMYDKEYKRILKRLSK